MKKTYFLLLTGLLLAGVIGAQSPSADHTFSTFSPSLQTRIAAEWEPAIGVLISWPPSIPHKLLQELANDTKLYLLVESRSDMQDAIGWLTKWSIFPDRVKFITSPHGVDVSWTRDWGPHAVFDTSGVMKLADPKYIYSTPLTGYACDDTLQFLFYDEEGKIELTTIDDEISGYISTSNGQVTLMLNFAFTGGNVISDGQQTAFSSCVLVNENKYLGLSEEKFVSEAQRRLGINNYHFISNFEERGIQHIDCFMKMLDEERLLVMQPPLDHPSYPVYEGILNNEIKQWKNAFGRPYEILRLDTDIYDQENPGSLAAYSNSLILNKTIYVPLFGIAQDSIALQQWRDAMPGYTVKGFEFVIGKEPHLNQQVFELYKGIGWQGGDALHCRTRAVWDPNMLYISVDRIPATVPKTKSYPLDVIIKDYSAGKLIPESLKVIWRVKGQDKWKEINLRPTNIPDHFSADIPGGQAGVTFEYYVTAKSYWGTMATMPRVVPEAYYEFSID